MDHNFFLIKDSINPFSLELQNIDSNDVMLSIKNWNRWKRDANQRVCIISSTVIVQSSDNIIRFFFRVEFLLPLRSTEIRWLNWPPKRLTLVNRWNSSGQLNHRISVLLSGSKNSTLKKNLIILSLLCTITVELIMQNRWFASLIHLFQFFTLMYKYFYKSVQ